MLLKIISEKLSDTIAYQIDPSTKKPDQHGDLYE